MKLPSIPALFFCKTDICSLETLFVTYKQSILSYRRFGQGDQLLFCFHGYGEDAATFQFLDKIIGEKYTCIALDFPFHGSTEWKGELLLSPDDLIHIMDRISPHNQYFSIIGYSMGGRVALQLLQIIPDRIKRLILIAPDGLHNNIWHQLSTQTLLGNKLFHYTMHHPKWMLAMMKTFYALGFFNKSIYNFVHYYLDEETSRLLLYQRWTTMRKFYPALSLLKKLISEKHIPVHMIFGKYDRVILSKRGTAFQKNIEQFVTVIEVEAGHQLLRSKYAAAIAAVFQS